MGKKLGVVYNAKSGEVYHWIVPDNDADLLTKHSLLADEAMLIVDKDAIKTSMVNLGGRVQPVADLDAIKAAVAAHLGKKSSP